MSEPTLFVIRRRVLPWDEREWDDTTISPASVAAFGSRAAAQARLDELERDGPLAHPQQNPFQPIEGVQHDEQPGDPLRWDELTSLEPGIWADYMREHGIEPPELPSSSGERVAYPLVRWWERRGDWDAARYEAFWRTMNRFRFYELLEIPWGDGPEADG